MNWILNSIALFVLVAVVAIEADHPGRGAIAGGAKVRKQHENGSKTSSKGSAGGTLDSQDNDYNDNQNNNNNNQNKNNQNQQNNGNDNNDNENDNDYNDSGSSSSGSNSNKNDNNNDNDYNDGNSSSSRGRKNNNNNNDYNSNNSNQNKNDNSNDYNNNDNDYVSSGSNSHSSNVHQSSGSYGDSTGSGSAKNAYNSNNLASVIRVSENRDQSLKDLYSSYAQTLVDLDFGRDYYAWNPRLNGANGSWQWTMFNNENNQPTPADNAVIQLVNANGKLEGGPYGASAQNSIYQNNNNYGSYATLSTLPYGSESYDEGFVQSTNTYSIGSTNRIVARMLFSCRTVDVDKNPFPKQYVTNPEDDERLANCGFAVFQANTTIFNGFFVTATNKGVWAVYVGATFIAKRRIGGRERYDSLVDGAIEIDGRTKIATFYLNGYKVWTIYQIGTLPPADGYTNIDLGAIGTETVSSFDQVYVAFGTEKCLDESNPWNQNDTTRLVRIRRNDDPSAAPYYGSSTFYDDTGSRGNLTWGQGAVMTLYKLKVLRTQSIAPRPVVLPGVYGDAASVYQGQQQQQQQSSQNQNYRNNINNNNVNNNNNRYQNNNNNNEDDVW